VSEPLDELSALRGRVFESSQEPQMELEALGVGELTVELDDEGKEFLEIPRDEHNKATSWLTRRFTLWAKEKWGYATSTNKVKPNNSKTRLAEIASFWGYPRCEWKPEVGELDVKIGEVEPDVVIEFSWKYGWDYDKAAINDMMNRSTGNNGNAIRLGYLYLGQMRFENSERNQPPTGLDIFKVPRGKTVADAMASNGCASHFSYTPGQEDRAHFCGSFKFSMAMLWKVIELVYV